MTWRLFLGMPTHLSNLLPASRSSGSGVSGGFLAFPAVPMPSGSGHSIGAGWLPVSAVEGGSIITDIHGGAGALAALDLNIDAFAVQ